MNKYEREQLNENLEKLKEVEASLTHLGNYHLYLYPICAKVRTARENIESVLNVAK